MPSFIVARPLKRHLHNPGLQARSLHSPWQELSVSGFLEKHAKGRTHTGKVKWAMIYGLTAVQHPWLAWRQRRYGSDGRAGTGSTHCVMIPFPTESLPPFTPLESTDERAVGPRATPSHYRRKRGKFFLRPNFHALMRHSDPNTHAISPCN